MKVYEHPEYDKGRPETFPSVLIRAPESRRIWDDIRDQLQKTEDYDGDPVAVACHQACLKMVAKNAEADLGVCRRCGTRMVRDDEDSIMTCPPCEERSRERWAWMDDECPVCFDTFDANGVCKSCCFSREYDGKIEGQ
jgi:hypothetical protein